MNIDDILLDWQLNPGLSYDEIDNVSKNIDLDLPREYRDFVHSHNGGEGFVGESYLILWEIGELEKLNRGYEVEKYAPGLLMFGSSGGGEGYAFDMRDNCNTVVGIPFVGMDLDYARIIADNFKDFLIKLGDVDDED
jgi:cell wall assembly regulator SMI1